MTIPKRIISSNLYINWWSSWNCWIQMSTHIKIESRFEEWHPYWWRLRRLWTCSVLQEFGQIIVALNSSLRGWQKWCAVLIIIQGYKYYWHWVNRSWWFELKRKNKKHGKNIQSFRLGTVLFQTPLTAPQVGHGTLSAGWYSCHFPVESLCHDQSSPTHLGILG